MFQLVLKIKPIWQNVVYYLHDSKVKSRKYDEIRNAKWIVERQYWSLLKWKLKRGDDDRYFHQSGLQRGPTLTVLYECKDIELVQMLLEKRFFPTTMYLRYSSIFNTFFHDETIRKDIISNRSNFEYIVSILRYLQSSTSVNGSLDGIYQLNLLDYETILSFTDPNVDQLLIRELVLLLNRHTKTTDRVITHPSMCISKIIENKNTELLKYLLTMELDERNFNINNIVLRPVHLHQSVQFNSIEIFQLILNNINSSSSIKNRDGIQVSINYSSLLSEALTNQSIDVIKYLCGAISGVGSKNNSRSALKSNDTPKYKDSDLFPKYKIRNEKDEWLNRMIKIKDIETMDLILPRYLDYNYSGSRSISTFYTIHNLLGGNNEILEFLSSRSMELIGRLVKGYKLSFNDALVTCLEGILLGDIPLEILDVLEIPKKDIEKTVTSRNHYFYTLRGSIEKTFCFDQQTNSLAIRESKKPMDGWELIKINGDLEEFKKIPSKSPSIDMYYLRHACRYYRFSIVEYIWNKYGLNNPTYIRLIFDLKCAHSIDYLVSNGLTTIVQIIDSVPENYWTDSKFQSKFLELLLDFICLGKVFYLKSFYESIVIVKNIEWVIDFNTFGSNTIKIKNPSQEMLEYLNIIKKGLPISIPNILNQPHLVEPLFKYLGKEKLEELLCTPPVLCRMKSIESMRILESLGVGIPFFSITRQLKEENYKLSEYIISKSKELIRSTLKKQHKQQTLEDQVEIQFHGKCISASSLCIPIDISFMKLFYHPYISRFGTKHDPLVYLPEYHGGDQPYIDPKNIHAILMYLVDYCSDPFIQRKRAIGAPTLNFEVVKAFLDKYEKQLKLEFYHHLIHSVMMDHKSLHLVMYVHQRLSPQFPNDTPSHDQNSSDRYEDTRRGYQFVGDTLPCVFPCPSPFFDSFEWRQYEIMVKVVGVVSFVTSLIVIMTYGLLNKKYDRHTTGILFLSFALFLIMLTDVVFVDQGYELLCPEPGRFARQFDKGCAATGIIFQFGSVSSVLWWSTMAFDLWLAIRKITTKTYEKYYIVVLNSVALILTLVPIAGDQYAYGMAGLGCWIKDSNWANGVFWIPLSIFLFIGMVFIVLILYEIYKVVHAVHKNNKKKLIEYNLKPFIIVVFIFVEFVYLFGYNIYLQRNKQNFIDEMERYVICLHMNPGNDKACKANTIPFAAQFVFLFFLRILGVEVLIFYGINTRVKKIWKNSFVLNNRLVRYLAKKKLFSFTSAVSKELSANVPAVVKAVSKDDSSSMYSIELSSNKTNSGIEIKEKEDDDSKNNNNNEEKKEEKELETQPNNNNIVSINVNNNENETNDSDDDDDFNPIVRVKDDDEDPNVELQNV
eukprot:gene6680-8264_t